MHKKKYRTDISRRENMAYDPSSDTYTCAAGLAFSVALAIYTVRHMSKK